MEGNDTPSEGSLLDTGTAPATPEEGVETPNHLIGKKLGVPTDKSSPEEVAAFRTALGVPESVEEYKFAPSAMPEGMTWSDEMSKPFAAIAHKHGIPPGAMTALADQFAQYESAKLGVMQEGCKV